MNRCNYVSIFVEVCGIIILTLGLIFEYIYSKDLYLLFITLGGLIFSIGSGLVKKFPWARRI